MCVESFKPNNHGQGHLTRTYVKWRSPLKTIAPQLLDQFDFNFFSWKELKNRHIYCYMHNALQVPIHGRNIKWFLILQPPPPKRVEVHLQG